MNRRSILIIAVLLLTTTACGTSKKVRLGQRLFAGCVNDVDDRASLASGQFVCKGPAEIAPFGGNGRSCGSCHMPGDRFGLSQQTIVKLARSHPLFFAGLDENQTLLRLHGLVHVVVPGSIDELRTTPKLVHLQQLCDPYGSCVSLGQLGDRVSDLCAFSRQAVANHMSMTLAREPGKDFRVPTDEECEALTAYMLSDLVADRGRE